MNFFIIGLPRSRTAWLAAFMNYCGAFCYHDGINGCSSVDQYRQKLGTNKGDSLTATLVDIEQVFPEAPKVIIDGDPDKAAQFGYELFGYDMRQWFAQMKRQLDEMEGLHIPVEEIDARLPEIWEHLQNTKYDSERAELIKRLNVQVQDPYDYDVKALMRLGDI